MNTATQLLERCKKNLLQQFASQGDCDEDLLENIEAYLAKQQECNPHPDAPHGFNRNASHNEGRYVCECEGWMPEQQVEQEPIGTVRQANGCTYVEWNHVPPEAGTVCYAAPQTRSGVTK